MRTSDTVTKNMRHVKHTHTVYILRACKKKIERKTNLYFRQFFLCFNIAIITSFEGRRENVQLQSSKGVCHWTLNFVNQPEYTADVYDMSHEHACVSANVYMYT